MSILNLVPSSLIQEVRAAVAHIRDRRRGAIRMVKDTRFKVLI
jgi:hypothetical protein